MSGGYDDELSRPLEGALEASTSEGESSPAVGRDEWVARHGGNREQRGGRLGTLEERLRLVPWWAWLTTFVALFALVPVASDNGYVRRVAFDIAIYMLLALGLNVVVGWGGLLDLGYVAFFGIGAYSYALLSSDHYGINLPTIVSIPLIVVIGAGVGLLVGLPSRRLTGDYLAIVTLFFLQLFLTITTNGDTLFGHTVTGGANGLLNVDPLSFSIVSGPSRGILELAGAAFIYKPNADFNGTDSFTFRANDGTVDSEAARISITVAPFLEKFSNFLWICFGHFSLKRLE